eukprot:746747-Rhodomonas_salina.1
MQISASCQQGELPNVRGPSARTELAVGGDQKLQEGGQDMKRVLFSGLADFETLRVLFPLGVLRLQRSPMLLRSSLVVLSLAS